MKENQNIEWKKSWRDEYIKWICGFANAGGGTLVIGKNDKGVVTGVDNAGRLLEDIPNKIRDILGIIVDVNLKTEKGEDFLEIHRVLGIHTVDLVSTSEIHHLNIRKLAGDA